MRIKPSYIALCICAMWWLANACVKPYEPPEITTATSLLVVDGMLQSGPNSRTVVKLSRTRRLNDTATSLPERGAAVMVEGESGERFLLAEAEPGNYHAATLPLNVNARYRLYIETGGSQYASDFVTFKETPPIDSITWEEGENRQVAIYLNTHDPSNNTRYYRWTFDETWEYRAFYESFVRYDGSGIVFRDSTELRYRCWRSNKATNILLGTSGALTEDVISRKRLAILETQSEKLSVRYSMLVQQMALTKEAFDYWQILQKNTEQRGSIFDAQPSQLAGNIHCLTNPQEQVVGYLSAASVQETRIFIKWEEIGDKYRPEPDCPALIVPTDSVGIYMNRYKYEPAYFVGSGGGAIAISKPECVNCTLKGGSTVKPLFW